MTMADATYRTPLPDADFERQLFASARGEEAPEASRQRIALGLGIAPPGLAPPGAEPPASGAEPPLAQPATGGFPAAGSGLAAAGQGKVAVLTKALLVGVAGSMVIGGLVVGGLVVGGLVGGGTSVGGSVAGVTGGSVTGGGVAPGGELHAGGVTSAGAEPALSTVESPAVPLEVAPSGAPSAAPLPAAPQPIPAAAALSSEPPEPRPTRVTNTPRPRRAAPNPAAPAPRATSPASRGASTPSSTPDPESRLLAEVQLLETARDALAAGHARPALAALARHAAEFSDGALSLDAAVLEVRALARDGQGAAAHHLARRTLARPDSARYSSELSAFINPLAGGSNARGRDMEGAR